MKTVIMEQTMPLLFKTQESVTELLESGFEQRQTEGGLFYMIKEEPNGEE